MHMMLDKRRLERVLPIVRDRGPAAYRAQFLRLEALNGELMVSGLAAEAVIPAIVEEPGVLFIRVKLLRSLVEGYERKTLDCRVTEEAFMLGSVRLPMKRKSLVYFSDPAKAPRVLPNAESLKVRYGAVVDPKKKRGTKTGRRARSGGDDAAMPLFDKEITQGFELRPPTRTVTRKLGFSAGKSEAIQNKRKEDDSILVVLDGKPSIRKFSQDQLKAVVLSVLGTTWRMRRDVIRSAAKCLGFKRPGRSIRGALALAIRDLVAEQKIATEGRQIRKVAG